MKKTLYELSLDVLEERSRRKAASEARIKTEFLEEIRKDLELQQRLLQYLISDSGKRRSMKMKRWMIECLKAKTDINREFLDMV